MLWFDVEERYNTTYQAEINGKTALWFDVEERYNTTNTKTNKLDRMLWFDVEERYNTTLMLDSYKHMCCGLM